MNPTTAAALRAERRQEMARPRLRAALAGVAATSVALGLSELIAGVLPGATSLIAAIGQWVIDHQPAGAKDVAVTLFGTNDKLALEVVVTLAALAFGAALGVLAIRRANLAAAAFGGFGVAGFVAALGQPQVNPAIVAVQAAGAVAAGIQALGWLSSGIGRMDDDAVSDPARRSFLLRAGALGIAGVAAGFVGRGLMDRSRAAPSTGAITIPPASDMTAPLAAGADLAPMVPGLTPIVMPNGRFYRIDTALIVPDVDTATWSLRIHGLVDRETTLTYEELVGLPLFEQYVTISCVSNEVGGNLVGNAKWTGVRLREVLDLAGVQTPATQLVGRSVDGFTAGMPTAWVMDPSREPMVAVKMNDEPLPRSHGFPARLIVPGLYGYVSATKWLSELELTTLDAFNGYWVPLGWAKEAPILTQSRIDTPTGDVAVGPVPVAGIAWAPDRGVSRVEVGIDGSWRDAELSAPISDATWVQWVYRWDATPGDHTISVRATDGRGIVQEEQPSRPAPDGARGWQAIRVSAR
jgi:DMSO/TMAO reductase YedYZ molybdopterin-dependent catalytic subunit